MSAKNRKTGNLVALGSAAVVAVYGAGFMRTAEAAQRFAEQSDERRVVADEVAPGVTVPGNANVAAPVNDVANAARNGAANVAANNAPAVGATAPVKTPADEKTGIAAAAAVRKVDATTAKDAEQTAPVSRAASASVPMPPEVTTMMSASGVAVTAAQPTAPVETRVPVAEKSAPIANSVSAQTVAAAPPVTTPPVAPAQNAKSAQALAAAVEAGPIPTVNASTTNSATVGAARYKDGNYTGYGTSRHGDVEVYLETTDGKITYVKISQCLTQYSCSWIEDLPRQVLARQSTKVDAISGATQSTNAFYYALVAALAKAK